MRYRNTTRAKTISEMREQRLREQRERLLLGIIVAALAIFTVAIWIAAAHATEGRTYAFISQSGTPADVHEVGDHRSERIR